MPEGTMWSLNSPLGFMTVWPALSPPEKRMTASAFSARRSTIFPLPSSPHWAPITATTDILFSSNGRACIINESLNYRVYKKNNQLFPGHVIFAPEIEKYAAAHNEHDQAGEYIEEAKEGGIHIGR